MKKTTRPDKPKVKADLITVPIFTGHDPVGQVMALAVAGQRDMNISVRGERVLEVEVERMPALEQVSQDLSLKQLVEMLKIKMYNESISDQTVYDVLFEDRLERQWARAYRVNEHETRAPANMTFWKKPK